MVKRLRRRPLTAQSRVRFPVKSPISNKVESFTFIEDRLCFLCRKVVQFRLYGFFCADRQGHIESFRTCYPQLFVKIRGVYQPYPFRWV